MMNSLAKRLLLATLAMLAPSLVWAQSSSGELVSDMSSHHVAISARYVGGSIILFGAMSIPGQIIVKVRSPDQSLALQKKGRTGPFWLAQEKYTVSAIPGLYYLLSSAPIDSLLPKAMREAQGLDLGDALKGIKVMPTPREASARRTVFEQVLRLLKARHNYNVDPKAVEIIGQRLYVTTIRLPSQLPLGKYAVTIYLVKDGKVLATQNTEIDVNEVGLEQWLFNAANQSSWYFGLVFTASMMLLGLFLGVVLGRKKT